MSGAAALRERLGQLAQALDRFGEALARDPASDGMLVDATIQRFEFSIELFWRAAQAALRQEGVEARSPRAALCGAYQQHWIDDEALWLAMIEDRDRTLHTYQRALALEILARLPRYHAAMRAGLERLRAV